jgi:hypothetical protein
VRRAQPFARDRSVELNLSVHPTTPTLVLADPQRLTQVLSNLLRSVNSEPVVYGGRAHTLDRARGLHAGAPSGCRPICTAPHVLCRVPCVALPCAATPSSLLPLACV